jgi:hypothetical protein
MISKRTIGVSFSRLYSQTFWFGRRMVTRLPICRRRGFRYNIITLTSVECPILLLELHIVRQKQAHEDPMGSCQNDECSAGKFSVFGGFFCLLISHSSFPSKSAMFIFSPINKTHFVWGYSARMPQGVNPTDPTFRLYICNQVLEIDNHPQQTIMESAAKPSVPGMGEP